MKQKKMTTIAVISGAACALCVVLFMMIVQGQANEVRAEALARYGGEQVEVCVATRDIAAGERMDLSAMETKLWVAGLLPDGAVRNGSDVTGQVATSSIMKGEVVTQRRFEKSKEAFDVPAGKQAVSVPVKAVQAVGGTVRPGMSVDVYSSGDTTTAILARSVVVLDTSVGDSGTLSASDSGWITLAVDPAQVQEVIAASNKTTLYFVIPGEQIEVVQMLEHDAQTEADTQTERDVLEETNVHHAQDAEGEQEGQDDTAHSAARDSEPAQDPEAEQDSQGNAGQPAKLAELAELSKQTKGEERDD